MFVVNRRFLSQLKVLGETVSVKLAPPILLLPKGWSFLKARGTLRVAQYGENKWGFCQNPHSTFAKSATINPKVGIPV